ncbi:F0F1 ATP synthase subunit gamma [Photobacterium galatheae]|uniref:F0F1 ATP synthase subunit gamma n=1 Tax=Photobacterium galatheae TaxID=1654360 RepID=UPI00254601B8|nr:F0F1 ATP synthase subunit gamma [Photobacterium galatheae]MCM0148928.1 F0F1 ATP synthase subunit gamma [Photobacterium galatheae]
MSNAHQISQKIALLDEISAIMNSLKTIAMIETQQSKQRLKSHWHGLTRMEQAALNFIQANPVYFLPEKKQPKVVFVFGSERGFCGDFNRQLINKINELTQNNVLRDDCKLVLIGYRLWNKLQNEKNVVALLNSASVLAELDDRLADLLECFTQQVKDKDYHDIALLYHDEITKNIQLSPLLTQLTTRKTERTYHRSLLLNLPKDDFFAEMISQYVLTRLNHILMCSFVAENEQRMQHLENALNQLSDQESNLCKQRNQQRQEQITEELQNILLGGILPPETR